jgi:hypothetical protein
MTGWGPNGRAWGDDEFWMDVLIQGVGWILVATTIGVSARQFYLQRKHAIEDDLQRKKDEEVAAERRRQDELLGDLQAAITDFTLSPLRGFFGVFTPSVGMSVLNYQYRIRALGRLLSDPVLRGFCEAYANYVHRQSGVTLVPILGVLWVATMYDHAEMVRDRINRYGQDGDARQLNHDLFNVKPFGRRTRRRLYEEFLDGVGKEKSPGP